MNESGSKRANFDVVVVGAGAAGLLAAIRCGERRRRTLLLEKNRKPGVKILMSGGTRCNITHDCEPAGIIAAFGSAGRFLHSPLSVLGPQDLVRMFEEEGLPTKVEPGGKVFPQSDRAADVLDALLRRLGRSGTEMALDEAVADISRLDGGFCVSTRRRAIECAKLIVTTGGKSYAGCGTTGDGYSWLASLGHTIQAPRPALVPLTSDEWWIHELAGVTVSDVLLRVMDRTTADSREPKQPRRSRLRPGLRIERRGSLLFTHFGLSGPAALDVSRAVTSASDPRDVKLVADFLPGLSMEDLDERLRQSAAGEGKRQIANLPIEPLPRSLIQSLVARAGVAGDRRAAELAKTERAAIVAQLKQCEINLTGTRGFDKAEVTAGGVALEEIDSRTMQSKLVPNLYLAGEILDLDGFIGGYNFQAAFSTGWLAGESV